MPPDSSYPSQVWIDDVRFFQDHFENQRTRNRISEYRSAETRRKPLGACPTRGRARHVQGRTHAIFGHPAISRCGRQKACKGRKGWRQECCDQGRHGSQGAWGRLVENPLVLERPDPYKPDAKTLSDVQWKRICHERSSAYRSAVGVETRELKYEMAEAKGCYTPDGKQEAIARRLKQELGPRPVERPQPMWDVYDRMEHDRLEFGPDRSPDGTFGPNEGKTQVRTMSSIVVYDTSLTGTYAFASRK